MRTWIDSRGRLRHEGGVQRSPLSLAFASAVLALMVVIIWLGAPVVPAVIGAVIAGYFVYRQDKKRRGG